MKYSLLLLCNSLVATFGYMLKTFTFQPLLITYHTTCFKNVYLPLVDNNFLFFLFPSFSTKMYYLNAVARVIHLQGRSFVQGSKMFPTYSEYKLKHL